MNYGWGDRQTHRQTDKKYRDTHLNTMTRPSLGAGPSEKISGSANAFRHNTFFLFTNL